MNPVSNNGAVGAVGIAVDSNHGVSVDEMILVCQSRMNDMDADVRRRLTGQQDRSALQAAIGNTLAKVKQLPGGKIDDDINKVNELAGEIDKEIEAAEKLGDTATANALRDAKFKLTDDWHGGRDGKCSTEDIDGVKSNLDTATKNASTNSELEMIDIQQLMAKRSQLLQMTTNMITSANSATTSITQNIGK